MSTDATNLHPAPQGDKTPMLALTLATLESVLCRCLDSIELSRVDTDAEPETLLRLLTDRLRLIGAEADAVLQVASVSSAAPTYHGWLLSPLQQELVAQLRGTP